MSNILNLSSEPDILQEVQPRSSLPWVWFGFFFAAAFLAEEFVIEMAEMDPVTGRIALFAISISGWIYWLFCVHRFHKILGEISRNQYPISGGEAVMKHFIPFYNIVWIFNWPLAVSAYLNSRGRVKMISGGAIGAALLVFMILFRFVDGAIGLAGIFGVGMYISGKLRKHLELLRNAAPGMMPPPPDPNQFRDPVESLPAGNTGATSTG